LPATAFPEKLYLIPGSKSFAGEKLIVNGKAVFSFELPASAYTKIIFK
jgi:hypothetical protein